MNYIWKENFFHSNENLHNRRVWESEKVGTLRGRRGQSMTVRSNDDITFYLGIDSSIVYNGTIAGSGITLGQTASFV